MDKLLSLFHLSNQTERINYSINPPMYIQGKKKRYFKDGRTSAKISVPAMKSMLSVGGNEHKLKLSKDKNWRFRPRKFCIEVEGQIR